MNDWVLLLLVLFAFILCILSIDKFNNYFYKRMAKSWNDLKKANKVNESISRKNRK